MAKGKKDINKLVPVRRMITRNGKSYETTVYVRQNQMDRVSNRGKNTVNTSEWEKIKTVDDLKKVMDGLTKMKDPADREVYRNEFIDFMKRSGVEWVEHEDKAINWMRCMMKAKRDIKVGYFRAEGTGKHKETRYTRFSREQAKQKMNMLKAQYSKETIRKFAEEDPNIQWKHSDHKGIDHMRMMMAIRESLEDGTGFKPLNNFGDIQNKEYFHQLQRLRVVNNLGAKLAKEGADIEYDEGNECLVASHKDSKKRLKVSIDKNGKIYVSTLNDMGHVAISREVEESNVVDYVFKRLGADKASDPAKLSDTERRQVLQALENTINSTPNISTRYDRVSKALYVSGKNSGNTVAVELTKNGEWNLTIYKDGNTTNQSATKESVLESILRVVVPERYQTAQQTAYPYVTPDKETEKELANATSIKTKTTGNQVNGRDPRAVYEKSKKTGETLYISPEYKNDVPFKKGIEYPDMDKCTDKKTYNLDWNKYNKMKDDYNKAVDEFVEAQLKRPKRFTTKEEVMKWADGIGIEIEDDLFTKVNIDFHAWTDITEVIDEIAENFPRILKPKKSPNDTGGKFKIKLSLAPNEEGCFMKANHHALYICRRTWNDQDGGWEGCLRSMARAIAKGHFVYGDGTYKQLVRHEFGHVLEYSLYTDEFGATEGKPKPNGTIPLKGLDWQLINDKDEDLMAMRRKRGKKYGKSRYGMKKDDPRETMAEAFTSFTSQKGTKKSDKTGWANMMEEFLIKWGLLK